MRDWQPKLIPLDRGLSQDSAENTPGVSFSRAVNLDFGKRGAVRGRPGYVRATGGYWLTGQNNYALTQTSKVNLAATGYTAVTPFSIIDKRSERPGLLTNGRVFSYEGNAWVDRFGAGACRVDRVADYRMAQTGGLPSVYNPLAVGYDFGPGNNIDQQVRLLSADGVRDVEVPGPVLGPGTGAMSGTTTATVHVSLSSSNLRMVIRAAGARSVTTVLLASDAAAPSGYGDNPVICSDRGYAGFFIAYKTTTAHTVKVLAVTTGGSITNTATVTYGAGTIRGLWVCNSDSPNWVTLCLVDDATNGIKTKVFNSSLVDQAIDVTLAGAVTFWGPVTCGASAAAGATWVTALSSDGSDGLGNPTSSLRIYTRSCLFAASTTYLTDTGFYYPPAGSAATQGFAYYLQHQPVLVNGRVVAGLAAIRAWNNVQTAQTATWYSVDLTDLIADTTATGSRRLPVMIARGVLDGSALPWNPVAAVVGADNNSYRFPTVDWTRFSGGTLNPNVYNGNTVKANPLGPATLSGVVGYDGALGMNEVSFQVPQIAHVGDTTVIGGSIPRGIAGGAVFDLGFQFLGYPACSAAPSSTGGSWTAGNYSIMACWKWTDDAGQVHRSAPSIPYYIGVSAGQKITFYGTPYHLGDKSLINFGDRGGVYIEFYMTDANPSGNAPHYLVAQITAENNAVAPTTLQAGPIDFTATPLLNGDVGILANLPVSADGGVVTVGRRCWVSDGDFVYASKLGLDGDAPNWNGDQDSRSGGALGPLAMAIPAGAGRILALSNIDERVIILCERGIYAVAGDGPDDLGGSSDFTAPLMVSPLGIAGHSAVTATPRGVVFQAAHQQLGDSERGGLWLLDKSLQTALASWPARDAVDTNQAGRLVFIPERGLVVFMCPAVPGNSGYVGGGNTGAQLTLTLPYIVIWDMHVNSWSVWTPPPDGTLVGIAAVGGYLWTAGTDVGGLTALPGVGYDSAGGVNTNFTMELQTNEVAAATDGLSWSRIRSLRVLGDPAPTPHTLTVAYEQDDAGAANVSANASHAFSLPATQQMTAGWPTDRYAPEWRIPHSKCSTIQVDLQATPAVATWTFLELQVKPERRAPAHTRA